MQSPSKGLPKSLMPVNNRPFLHYQLTSLAKQGIKEILLCIGHGAIRSNAMRKTEGPGSSRSPTPVKATICAAPEAPCGWRMNKEQLEPISLSYGDSFLPVTFPPVWTYFETRTEPALMVVLKNEGRWDKSNARFDGQKVTCYDKRKPCDRTWRISITGRHVLRAEAVDQAIPSARASICRRSFSQIQREGKLAGFEVARHGFMRSVRQRVFKTLSLPV